MNSIKRPPRLSDDHAKMVETYLDALTVFDQAMKDALPAMEQAGRDWREAKRKSTSNLPEALS